MEKFFQVVAKEEKIFSLWICSGFLEFFFPKIIVTLKNDLPFKSVSNFSKSARVDPWHNAPRKYATDYNVKRMKKNGIRGNDGFNRVQTERPHQVSPKIHQNMIPLHKKLLYLFIVAPGCQWHVKKKRKKLEDQQLAPLKLLIFVLVEMCGKVQTFFLGITMSWGSKKCLSMLWITQE